MDIPAKYWTLNYINSLGQLQVAQQPPAKEFIISQIPSLSTNEQHSAPEITTQLWRLYKTESTALLAELCLGCLISHQLKQVCEQLVSQYGEKHNFTTEDLLPLVLEEGRGKKEEGRRLSDQGAGEQGSRGAREQLPVTSHQRPTGKAGGRRLSDQGAGEQGSRGAREQSLVRQEGETLTEKDHSSPQPIDSKVLRKGEQHHSLTDQILQTFNPEKSSLFTWTKRIVKTNKEIKRFLLVHGIEQITDWLLLKQTAPKKLARILGDFHSLSNPEVHHFQQLLTSYQTIYVEQILQKRNQINQQRKAQGLGKLTTPYPVPTQEQLQQIAHKLSIKEAKTTEEILTYLQTLATYIRQYKANGARNVPSQSLGKSATKLAAKNSHDVEDQEVLTLYRELLNQCLTAAIKDVVEAKVTYLSKKKKPKHQQFLHALHLFHCHHVPMKEIASQVGLNSHSQVVRLLELKTFRSDISRRTLVGLRHQVMALAKQYNSASELKDLEAKISDLVTEQVDNIMAEASKETTVSKNRRMCSQFAQTLCHYLSLERKKEGGRRQEVGGRRGENISNK